jgi:aryl-alcohol dehydrogenase-like predicted oxidoreductase
VQYRELTSEGPRLSRIGLGSWAFGGPDWGFGWGPQDERDSISTIHAAVELGVNWLDTAPIYGLGCAERLIGKAVAELPRSERPLISTKCSLGWTDEGEITHALDARSIQSDVEGSLDRLGVEALDLCQIHWPAYGESSTDQRLEEAMGALGRLRESGKVRWIGASNFNVAQLDRARSVAPVVSVQLPYSLLDRTIDREVLPACRERGVAVLAYSVLQSGLLTGRMTRSRLMSLPDDDWRRAGSPDFQEPRLSIALELVERLRSVVAGTPLSVASLALACTLSTPGISAAIVGARRPAQIRELAEAGELSVPMSVRAGIIRPGDAELS